MMIGFVRIAAFAAALLAVPAFAQSDLRDTQSDRPEGSASEITETLDVDRAGDRLTRPVAIGLHGPFPFLVETGSEATVVSGEVADELGLARQKGREVVSIAGRADTHEVILDELVVGSRRIRDVPAAVIAARHIGAQGIIGIESLQDQRITLDFRARTIVVAPSPGRLHAGANEIVVTARRQDKRLIVKRALLGGRPIDVVIDTGSSFSVANTALRDKYYKRADVLAKSVMTDVLGHQRPVNIINAGRLEIDRLTINDTLVAVADTKIFEELGLTERPAILLGMNHLRLFRRIAVDFRRRQIAFELNKENG